MYILKVWFSIFIYCFFFFENNHFTILWWSFPYMGFLGSSLVAPMVKNPPTMQETQVWFPGRENALEEEMATHSSILAWTVLWGEEPGGQACGLQSMGSQRVRYDWATNVCHTWTWIGPRESCVPPGGGVLNSPPTPYPTISLWVVLEHWLWGPCFTHGICTVYLFYVW